MPSKPLLKRFFAKRLNRSRSTPSFRTQRPVLRGGDRLPAKVKKVDPTGFSATAISCVENLGANTWQDTTELVTVRLGDVAHPKGVGHLCSNRFHDTPAWGQASRYLNCVMRGSGWPFFEKTALGSVSGRGAHEIAKKPALPVPTQGRRARRSIGVADWKAASSWAWHSRGFKCAL